MKTKFHDEVSQRVDPELVAVVHREHLDRYRFSLDYCRDRRVLEIGCGFGYGTFLLAEAAREVHGVDVYPPALEYARTRYTDVRVHFHHMDGCELTFEDESFDTVVAFEVIEHVEDPCKFLAGVQRVLKPGGIAIISTPNGDVTIHDGTLSDPTHLREFRRDEFTQALRTAGFPNPMVLGQELSSGVWQVHDLCATASRFDVLKIRRVLSGAWKRRLFTLLVGLRFGKSPERIASTTISEDTRAAHCQIAVCNKVASHARVDPLCK